MAKTKMGVGDTYTLKAKVRRPGIHSKKKASSLKTSKNYKKSYNKQGR